jgi:phosphatidate cytidylyltransferase
MAIVWVSDSAAYFTGKAIGRHKLAPALSPGKTWEGVGGGLVAVLVYSLVLGIYLPELVSPWWATDAGPVRITTSIWLVLAVAGIFGDLAESWAKRVAGVKDSGTLLPGHGGLLDRVDATLPLLPIAALIYLR